MRLADILGIGSMTTIRETVQRNIAQQKGMVKRKLRREFEVQRAWSKHAVGEEMRATRGPSKPNGSK